VGAAKSALNAQFHIFHMRVVGKRHEHVVHPGQPLTLWGVAEFHLKQAWHPVKRFVDVFLEGIVLSLGLQTLVQDGLTQVSSRGRAQGHAKHL
jgi:hypothetical protein